MTRTAGSCSAHQPNPYFCNMKGLLCQKVSACAEQNIATARNARRLLNTHCLVTCRQQAIPCKLVRNGAFWMLVNIVLPESTDAHDVMIDLLQSKKVAKRA